MSRMVPKSLPLSIIAFSCCAAVAAAQETGPSEPLDPAQLQKLLPKHGTAAGSDHTILGFSGATLKAAGGFTLGWNYFHATNCELYTDGVNYYVYVIPAEGGYAVTENNTYASNTFLTGCANGNWEAVHVTDATTGAFDAIWVYTFK